MTNSFTKTQDAKKQGLIFSALVFCFSASGILLAKSAIAQSNEIEELEVVGTSGVLALPVKNLDQSDLQESQSGNLAETLEKLPGIHNASFGEGVGRPVIRGLSANRVKLAVNGATNADVSAMSSDHAPMMEMATSESVEVIYGPSTLRFGSGAMGGMVNLKDNRFHEKAFAGTQARLQGSAGSNASSGQVAATVDTAFAGDDEAASILHASIFARGSDDFTAGDGEKIPSSETEGMGGALGYNYVNNDKGSIGLAFGYTDYEYGVPNNEDTIVKVTPEQWRIDVQGNLLDLTPSLKKWETKLGYIDYQHEELVDDFPQAYFEKQVAEFQTSLFFDFSSDWSVTTGLQLQYDDFGLCHDHGGCDGIPDYSSLFWNGNVGANLINDTFGGYRFSHSTPMPLSETMDAGLYFILGKTFETLTTEFGVRYDNRNISTDPTSILPSYRRDKADYDDQSFNPVSVSAGFSWDLGKHRVALNIAHSERAPTVEEMYYNGDHHATFSYQLDNIDLDIEASNSVDLTWQADYKTFLVEVTGFIYEFSDYIYNDLKPISDPYHGRDVYRYEQEDASFVGGEVAFEAPFLTDWLWFASADIVRARLKQGTDRNLPRTPPASLRSGVKWEKQRWKVETDFHHFAKQDDVSANESESDAYTTWNAFVAYDIELAKTEVTLQFKANNILDEFGANHTSYLKDFSPIQGRNFEAGFIVNF